MNRYQNISKTYIDKKLVYTTSRYPEIPLSVNDIYVYTTQGDRYDLLALSYYGNAQLWWVIARANTNNTIPDSLYPNVGEQIRIPGPSRISFILGEYESLNR